MGIPVAGALSAEYIVLPNGTAYHATIEIADAARYEFADVGFMGEKVPLPVSNVTLTGDCTPCNFTWSRPWGAPSVIMFDKGNYTVSYLAPLSGNNLQGQFIRPYSVAVTIPGEFSVKNPLLAGMSQGANVTHHPDNTTSVRWEKTTVFNVRFYDQWHENMLWFFLQFMAILTVILVVVPYLLSMKKAE
ncbi:MAG: hypothetical protein CW742_10075 [Methanoregula sp.]|nr:MAG: hypothetical protein CW742_10075 [Methanoregula sp.]